jgi:hypothetical protein
VKLHLASGKGPGCCGELDCALAVLARWTNLLAGPESGGFLEFEFGGVVEEEKGKLETRMQKVEKRN